MNFLVRIFLVCILCTIFVYIAGLVFNVTYAQYNGNPSNCTVGGECNVYDENGNLIGTGTYSGNPTTGQGGGVTNSGGGIYVCAGGWTCSAPESPGPEGPPPPPDGGNPPPPADPNPPPPGDPNPPPPGDFPPPPGGNPPPAEGGSYGGNPPPAEGGPYEGLPYQGDYESGYSEGGPYEAGVYEGEGYNGNESGYQLSYSTYACSQGPCFGSSDCRPGLTCYVGVCRNPVCASDASCTCSPTPTSGSAPTSSVPTPTPTPPGLGCWQSTCFGDFNCKPGLTCTFGVCGGPSCPSTCSTSCTSSANCQSGQDCFSLPGGNQCRNIQCYSEPSCICPITTPTPTTIPGCGVPCSKSPCPAGFTCNASQLCVNPVCPADASCACLSLTPTPTGGGGSLTPTPTGSGGGGLTCGQGTCFGDTDCAGSLTCTLGICGGPSCSLTPTPTSGGTNPTPTAIPGCGLSCSKSACPAGLTCNASQLCVNPVCPADPTCACLSLTPTPTGGGGSLTPTGGSGSLTPTPTGGSGSLTPTVAPGSKVCNQQCSVSSECASGYCVDPGSGTYSCRNSSCPSDNTCTCTKTNPGETTYDASSDCGGICFGDSDCTLGLSCTLGICDGAICSVTPTGPGGSTITPGGPTPTLPAPVVGRVTVDNSGTNNCAAPGIPYSGLQLNLTNLSNPSDTRPATTDSNGNYSF